MNNPRALMRHKADFFKATFAAGNQPQYGTAPTIKGIRCFVQPAPSEVIDDYKQRQDQVSSVLYTLDGESYAQISVRDRIIWEGQKYRVIGRQDFSGLGLMFRVDLKEDLSAQ